MPNGGILRRRSVLNAGHECSFLFTLDYHQTAACNADVRLSTGRSLPHDMHVHNMINNPAHASQQPGLDYLGCTCDLKGVKLAESTTTRLVPVPGI